LRGREITCFLAIERLKLRRAWLRMNEDNAAIATAAKGEAALARDALMTPPAAAFTCDFGDDVERLFQRHRHCAFSAPGLVLNSPSSFRASAYSGCSRRQTCVSRIACGTCPASASTCASPTRHPAFA